MIPIQFKLFMSIVIIIAYRFESKLIGDNIICKCIPFVLNIYTLVISRILE